ncbi:MAG: hypothetical protein GY926_17235, partial [bacterium]|nr:hypothetical protein [bacterium]
MALAGNSTLNLGTEAAPAALNLGWNQVTSGFSTGNANGVFEALDRDAEVNLHLGDLNVGVGTTQGSAMGTMKWDQTEVIDATNVYFGRGNSTGILEVPAGGEIHFGSGADRVSNFRIAYNDAGGGTANADLDLSLTDPTFTADISDDLSIGRVTSNGAAFGSLTLGGNSTVNLGTAAAPATLNLGWNQVTSGFSSGNANGVFDTTVGAFTADLSTLTIARTSNRGSATG